MRRRAPALRRRHDALLAPPRSPTSSRSWWPSRSASPSTSCGWWPQSVGGGFGSKLERLRRGAALRRPGPQARRAGALGRGAHRERPGHHPGPRPDPGHRAGRRRRRQAHRRAGQPHRRHGRLPAARHRRASRCSAPSSTPASTTCRRPTRSRCTGGVHHHDARPTPTAAPAGPRPPTPSSGPWTRLAARCGIDPVELRRRNFIKAEQFPYTAMTGLVYDSGDHVGAARRRRSSWPTTTACGPSRPQRRAAGDTKHLGIGISSYFEMCGLAPSRVLASLNYGAGGWEPATVRVAADQQGAGRHRRHAARPGPRDVVVDDRGRQARRRPGRRRGAALRHRHQPARARHLRLALAGRRRRRHRHGARQGARQGPAPSPPTSWRRPRRTSSSTQGTFSVPGLARPRRCRWPPSPSRPSPPTTCPTAWSPTSRRTVTYDPPNFSWPFGTHICVVEVDEETGAVDVLKYVAVDDCGNQINPLIVEGQVHGGVVQGLAQALFEEAVYDERRQPHARRPWPTTWCRRPSDVPSITTDHTVTPSPTNPLGREGHRRGRHHRCRPRGHQRHRRRPVPPRRHRHRHARLAPDGSGPPSKLPREVAE